MYNETFLRRAIEISAEALSTAGTEPFGAIIVKDGKIVGEGINRSLMNHDPTSHGETEAIRDACRNLETVDLRGCELYSSCEPCALCVAAMNIAGITALYYAADMAQAGSAIANLPEAARFPVDVDRLTHECGRTVSERFMSSEQHLDTEATNILEHWASLALSRV
ncbi:MAG: tRNA-specific adenosine deaminase [Candidatus Endolissoclinum sp. TMED37]|nr:MAG: tRNA-specific adenosine deaminase [Candidatus Endolissoclinum sp. TMED37]